MKLSKSIGVLACLLAGSTTQGHDHTHAAPVAHARHAFVENLGQWPEAVLFRAPLSGAALFVEQDGWTWSKYEAGAAERMHDFALLGPAEQAALRFNGHAWRVRFAGALSDSRAVGEEKGEAYHNYFLGNDRNRWKGHVGIYGTVHHSSVWPGIDIVLREMEGNFKYDVLVQPGADVGTVQLAYEGLESLSLDERGQLVMGTSVGEIFEMAPVAFYGDEKGGAVPVRFKLQGNTVSFSFPEGYDQRRPLTIDPLLVAGTYSGGTGDDNYGHCATYDNEGNIYTGARNFGPVYPATVGAFQTTFGGGGTDISLSKYSPDGSELIWAAYLGGSSGENPHSLITNTQGELVVLGSTNSTNFPITAGAYDDALAGQDIAVVHIAADGSYLVGSTFVGGAGEDGTNDMYANYGEAYRGEVYVDGLGNIIITSFTSSNDFPVTSGALQGTHGGQQDGVVVKLDPTCSNLLASTFLGGSLNDNAMGVRIAANGDLFVTGATHSNNFPVTTGVYQGVFQGGERDGYIVRLSSDLTTVVAGTFFGTSASDRPYFMDLDSEDHVWIYGQTDGSIAIQPTGTYGATGGEIFVAKLTPDLTAVPVSTMIPGQTVPVAFLVDVCDHIYISGYNTSGNMPTTPDALHTTGSFYLASFDVNMTDILFGTHYGGSHVDGGTSRFDKNGIVYQGVCSGGNSMQTTPWAYATTNQLGWDIGVFKIDFETAGVQANITSTGQSGCVPATFTLTATGQAVEFIWDLGDGSPQQTGTQVTVSYDEIGTYVVRLIGSDPGACNLADTTYFTLNVYDPNELVAAFDPVPLSTCDGYILQLTNNSIGATNYEWSFGDGGTATGAAPSHEYDEPGTYTISLEARNTICADTADISIPVTFVTPSIDLDLASPVAICASGTATLTAEMGYDTYYWSTGSTSPNTTVDEPGSYTLEVTDGVCEASDEVEVVLAPPPPPQPDALKCIGREVQVGVNFPVTSILWSNGSPDPTISVEDPGTVTFTAVDAYGCDVAGAINVIELPATRAENFIPNVVTPNGDDKNDRFQVAGEGLQEFHMEVYDRWGLKMFETSNQQNGWNGGLDNTSSKVPEGTYYYIIDFRDLCSEEPFTTKTGHVTVLR